jgi:hypothetical protein
MKPPKSREPSGGRGVATIAAKSTASANACAANERAVQARSSSR